MSDDELLEVINEQVRGPAFTTGEVAQHVDMTEEGVRRRLYKLLEKGRVDRKKPGRNTVMWFDPDTQKLPDSEA